MNKPSEAIRRRERNNFMAWLRRTELDGGQYLEISMTLKKKGIRKVNGQTQNLDERE